MARESRIPGEKPLFLNRLGKGGPAGVSGEGERWAGNRAQCSPVWGQAPTGPNLGKAKGRESSKWLKISEAIRSGRFTQCVLKGQSTYFTPFRKSHGEALRLPSQILS